MIVEDTAAGTIVLVFKGLGMLPNESRKRFVATQTLLAQIEVPWNMVFKTVVFGINGLIIPEVLKNITKS